MGARLGIDTESRPGHWIVSTENLHGVRKERRRRYLAAGNVLERGRILRAGCAEWRCVNPEHAKVAGRAAVTEGLVEEYRSGASVEQAAEALNVSLAYAMELLIDAGEVAVPERKPAARLDGAVRDRAVLLIQEGLPDRWVGEDLDISTEQIRNLRRKLGIDSKEWVKVQLACRKAELLAPLHALFNPGFAVPR